MKRYDFRINKRKLRVPLDNIQKDHITAINKDFEDKVTIANLCNSYLNSMNEAVLERLNERMNKRFQNNQAVTTEVYSYLVSLMSGYLVSPEFKVTSEGREQETWFQSLNTLLQDFPMWSIITKMVSAAISYGTAWLYYDPIPSTGSSITLNPIVITPQQAIGLYNSSMSETLEALAFPAKNGSVKIYGAGFIREYDKDGILLSEEETGLDKLAFVEWRYNEGIPLLSKIKSKVDAMDIVISAGVESHMGMQRRILVMPQNIPDEVLPDMPDTIVIDGVGSESVNEKPQLIDNTQEDQASSALFDQIFELIQRETGVYSFAEEGSSQAVESGIALRARLQRLTYSLMLLKASSMHSIRESIDLLLTYLRTTNIRGVATGTSAIPEDIDYNIELDSNLPDDVQSRANVVASLPFLSVRTRVDYLNLPNVDTEEEVRRIEDELTQYEEPINNE